MSTVNAIENQTLFDLSIEQTGSVLSVIEIALANGRSITDDLSPGNKLNARIEGIYFIKDIAEYFKGKNQKLASAGDLEEFDSFGGIGYWILEVDFQVK